MTLSSNQPRQMSLHQPQPDNYSFLLRALSGGVAGMIETSVTMPLETTKTIQQLQTGPSSSLLSTAQYIRTHKGLAGFYYGMPACLVQASGKVAIRFSFYGMYQKQLQNYFGTCEAAGGNINSYPNMMKGTAGLLAGSSEALWITPCERLKTLRVSQVDVETRNQQFTSMAHTLRRLNGPLDLYVGFVPTSIRNGLAVGGRFLMYDQFKETLADLDSDKEKLWWHPIMCGFAVGAVTTVLSQPADVVKSRMQGHSSFSSSSSSTITTMHLSTDRMSMMKSTINILKSEGWNGITRGLTARIWKIGCGQAVIFTVYESVSDNLSKVMNL